jgi:hypothetical protein
MSIRYSGIEFDVRRKMLKRGIEWLIWLDPK